MRRFLQLAAVLFVAVVAAGSPLTVPGAPPAAAVATPAPQAAPAPFLPSSPSASCFLPQCDGPYCRASNGCLVCCHG